MTAFFVSCFLILSSSFSFAEELRPSIAELKEAFKQGFLSTSVNGEFILSEMSKYDLVPMQFVTNFREYDLDTQTPIYFVDLDVTRGTYGELIVFPKVSLAPYVLSRYQNASYLRSLLEYNKDLLDLHSYQVEVPIEMHYKN